MKTDPNKLFLDKSSLPSYHNRLWKWSSFSNSNWELHWILWEWESFQQKGSILMTTLDLSCYTKLRNNFPDLQFVTRKVKWSNARMQKLPKKISLNEISINKLWYTKSWKQIFRCSRNNFEVDFTAISAKKLSIIDTKSIKEDVSEKNLDGNKTKITKELLNIFWSLNGPEIIYRLLNESNPKKDFEITFMKQSNLWDEIYIGWLRDLVDKNYEKIKTMWFDWKDSFKAMLSWTEWDQKIIAYIVSK